MVVTGAAGFVGRRVVALLEAQGERVVAIGRGPRPDGLPVGVRWITADLLNADAYREALQGADCVFHAAAVTGKARPAEYVRSNVEATRTLLDACAKAGVKRFVFVSSIAATFTDRSHYHYAESKIAAEELVRKAPIPATILRPTMIMGTGSPVQANLERLAKAPVIPVFGTGQTKVQPVDVDDVAEALVALAREPEAAGAVIEIGGPNVCTMNELLVKLRGTGETPRLVHLPLGPIRSLLALLGGPLFAVLPLTAGQLSSFANDGVATPHPILDRILPRRREAPAAREPAPRGPSGGAGEAAIDETRLAREFERYAAYLIGAAVTPYQTQKYIAVHRRRPLQPQSAFDAFLLRFSQRGRIGLSLADAYSGLFGRTSLLRRKLMAALAILECSPPSFAALDAPDRGGRGVVVLMGARLALAAAAIVTAALVLLPVRIVSAALPNPKG